MATWQASFDILVSPAGLPADYLDRASGCLPRGKSWCADIQLWGHQDSDLIEVSTDAPVEVSARFDMRSWNPALYRRFLEFVQHLGGTLRVAGDDEIVETTEEAFHTALRKSPAARFVADPPAYLASLGAGSRK